jgi:hypothetical protein
MAKKKQSKEDSLGIAHEPAALAKRRSSVLKSLQTQSSKSSGPLQQVLRKLHQLVASTEPDALYDGKLYGEVAAAFQRLVKSMETAKKPLEIPDIIAEANEFIVESLNSLRDRMQKAGLEVPAEKKIAVEQAAAIAQGIKDEMAKAPSRRNTGEILGNVDAPVAGGPATPEKKIPEDLKKWVNPGRGRIGNK